MAHCEAFDQDILMTLHGEHSFFGSLRVRWHMWRCRSCQGRSRQFQSASDLLCRAMRDATPFPQVSLSPSRRGSARLLLVAALLIGAALAAAWFVRASIAPAETLSPEECAPSGGQVQEATAKKLLPGRC